MPSTATVSRYVLQSCSTARMDTSAALRPSAASLCVSVFDMEYVQDVIGARRPDSPRAASHVFSQAYSGSQRKRRRLRIKNGASNSAFLRVGRENDQLLSWPATPTGVCWMPAMYQLLSPATARWMCQISSKLSVAAQSSRMEP